MSLSTLLKYFFTILLEDVEDVKDIEVYDFEWSRLKKCEL